MKILALEHSTTNGSLMLSENETPIMHEKWNLPRRDNYDFFASPELSKIDLKDVDVFATGLGPGSFTGIRIALTAVKTMALPHKKQIFAVSSGEILAQQSGAENVGVIGDARRNRIWAAIFKRYDNLEIYRKVKDYQLLSTEEADSFLYGCDKIVSPDIERFTKYNVNFKSINLISQSTYPQAETLSKIVYRKITNSIDSDILEPVYLHPAVIHRTKKQKGKYGF